MSTHLHALIILDGFGYREQQTYNAISQADTPTITYLFNTYPHTFLKASGTAVGLPANSIGNSEVGHFTIGAGRIIKQPVVRLNEMIENHTLLEDAVTTSLLEKTKLHDKTVHLFGLLSDANVHSNEHHLYAMLAILNQKGFSRIVIHPFLDGRDTPPRSAEKYLNNLERVIKQLGVGIIGSIHGRFYAMDRDRNWERTEQSYKVLTQQHPIHFTSWREVLSTYYAQNITDEFIPPTPLHDHAIIKDDDTVIFFNFRPDRARQLTAAFVAPAFNGFHRKLIPLTGFITSVQYDLPALLPAHALLKPVRLNNTLKQELNDHHISMFSIAETEKYAHVTYFFNGENEAPLLYEERVLIPSIPAKNYIHKPDMSARLITNAIIHSLTTAPREFYLINYANADMVGHSGNMEATIKAVECLDHQIEALYKHIVLDMKGTLYITSDHGNAEYKFNSQEQQPSTAHTTNPVPFILVNNNVKNTMIELPLTGLSDIAPFILKEMNIPIPKEMIHEHSSHQ